MGAMVTGSTSLGDLSIGISVIGATYVASQRVQSPSKYRESIALFSVIWLSTLPSLSELIIKTNHRCIICLRLQSYILTPE